MTRHQLEHLIRACADITDDDELVVIGSQSILASHPDAPPELLVSMEADIFPLTRPERWELIDGTIGELSPFHETFGYYAQGVSETTATLPTGWRDRLVPLRNANTRGATGWCLEPHDLVVAKAVAGRGKDERYVKAAVRNGLVAPATLRSRLDAMDLDPAVRARAERWFASS